MVRRIVGALVEVGSGSCTQSEFEALVRDAHPGAARKVAPARGLCLMKVRYEDELFSDPGKEPPFLGLRAEHDTIGEAKL
jgi:tRNA U38,U39,U40 pseudouridine synthase TruA